MNNHINIPFLWKRNINFYHTFNLNKYFYKKIVWKSHLLIINLTDLHVDIEDMQLQTIRLKWLELSLALFQIIKVLPYLILTPSFSFVFLSSSQIKWLWTFLSLLIFLYRKFAVEKYATIY